MIDKDVEHSTDAVTSESNTIKSHETDSTMLPADSVPLGNFNTEKQYAQNAINDQNNSVVAKESENNQLTDVQLEEEQQNQLVGEDDEFIRITAAHQMLTEAQTYDERKNYPAALHLYRICVDLLLEELMFTEGTEQSRVYLREKCTAIMDRIDTLKAMLEPLPSSVDTTNETLPLLESSSSPPPPLPAAAVAAATTTTTSTSTEKTTANDEAMNPPTETLNSLHLS